eukprot:1143533-Pelagomonas_calceolata.AAC.12
MALPSQCVSFFLNDVGSACTGCIASLFMDPTLQAILSPFPSLIRGAKPAHIVFLPLFNIKYVTALKNRLTGWCSYLVLLNIKILVSVIIKYGQHTCTYLPTRAIESVQQFI